MKNVFYVACLLILTSLSSFTMKSHHSSSKKVSTKKFSCAVATNLLATKNYSQITFTWSGSQNSSYSCGGYYNYTDVNGNKSTNFTGSSVSTNAYTINVPTSTYSVTFRVTTLCADGSTNTSSPASFSF